MTSLSGSPDHMPHIWTNSLLLQPRPSILTMPKADAPPVPHEATSPHDSRATILFRFLTDLWLPYDLLSLDDLSFITVPPPWWKDAVQWYVGAGGAIFAGYSFGNSCGYANLSIKQEKAANLHRFHPSNLQWQWCSLHGHCGFHLYQTREKAVSLAFRPVILLAIIIWSCLKFEMVLFLSINNL